MSITPAFPARVRNLALFFSFFSSGWEIPDRCFFFLVLLAFVFVGAWACEGAGVEHRTQLVPTNTNLSPKGARSARTTPGRCVEWKQAQYCARLIYEVHNTKGAKHGPSLPLGTPVFAQVIYSALRVTLRALG